jgi:hypothetical protein
MSDLNSDFKVNLLDLNLALNNNLQLENIIDLWNYDITLNIYNINQEVIKSIHYINVSSTDYQNILKNDIYYIRGGNLLKTISNEAFVACRALTNVNFTDCSSLQTIGGHAFLLCIALKSVDFTGCTDLSFIGGEAFVACRALTNVNFTDCSSLQTIYDLAFYECYSLTSLDFSGCTSLSYNSFGTSVFEESSNIITVDVTNSGLSNLSDSSLNDIFRKSGNDNNIDYIGNLFSMKLYNSSNGLLSQINDINVSSTDYQNILKNDIYKITGGTLLTGIGFRGFYETSNLESVDFTNCTSLTSIDKEGFFNCSNLINLNFTGCSSLKTIGSMCFKLCGINNLNLTTCISLNKLDGAAFQECSSLLGVDLTGCASLQIIAGGAFRECNSLTSVYLTGCTSLQTIGNLAFYQCTSLMSIDFSGCSTLTLSNIDINAFIDTPNLITVNITNSGLSSETDTSLNTIFKQSGNTNTIDYIGNIAS